MGKRKTFAEPDICTRNSSRDFTTSVNLFNKFVSAVILTLEIEIRTLTKIKQPIQIYIAYGRIVEI